MRSKLVDRLLVLIEQDIMETEHLLALYRDELDRVDANDVVGQDKLLTMVAQQMRKLAQLKAERHDWTMKG